jgi:hypothetical protein
MHLSGMGTDQMFLEIGQRPWGESLTLTRLVSLVCWFIESTWLIGASWDRSERVRIVA